MASDTPWVSCQVCGHADHEYKHHLNEAAIPKFVNESVTRLHNLERAGSDIDTLVADVSQLVDKEEGSAKAWAIWLLKLLEELEEAAEAPDVAAEIETFLDGYSR